MRSLIGINGKIGSGKDTVGEIIQQLCKSNGDSNWQIKKFADKLKDICAIIIGCDKNLLEDQNFKNKELGKEWWYWELPTGSKIPYLGREDFNAFPVKLVKPTARLMLQRLGTEAMRNNIHDDIWVNSLFSSFNVNTPAYNSKKWIITDLRFLNEMEAIKNFGGITIRVKRNTDQESYHPSETSLDNEFFDYEIDNNGPMTDLIRKVREILIKEKIIE